MRAEPLLLALATALAAGGVHAGTFTFTDELNTNRVTHPDNYTGTGGPRTVTVCLDPAALPVNVAGTVPTDEDPTQALNNVAAEFTRDTGTAGNVLPAVGVGIPGGRSDFESVAMHEVGHCLGLDHNTLGPSEIAALGECDAAGMPACADQAARNKRFFTNSYKGVNAVLDLGLGNDGERGSRDDARVDDLNFHWYRLGANNPFEVPPAIVDRLAYSNLTALLPVGHTFVEVATSFDPCGNPGADTSALRGQPPTSAIMFPILCGNNVVRQTAWDDVATLRIAKAGNNGVDDSGSGDDYTVSVGYIGQTASCDIVVRFIAGAGFAFCDTGAAVNGTNVRITSAVVNFERSVNWWFNQTNTAGPPTLIFRHGFEDP